MKLKLFFLSIFALLSLIAYQKYSEYSSLRSIDSYESCATAKGSTIQESYPSTCITGLGRSFVQLISPNPSTSLKDNFPEPLIIIPSSTANWKTYLDSQHLFSFKYPQVWTKKLYSERVLFTPPIPAECLPPNMCSGQSGFLSVQVQNNSKNLSLNQYANEYLKRKDPDSEPIYFTDGVEIVALVKQLTDRKLPGAIIFGIGIPGACGGDIIFIIKDKAIYTLEFECLANTDISGILSTFKFTN